MAEETENTETEADLEAPPEAAGSDAHEDAPTDAPEEAALEPQIPAEVAEALTPKERRRRVRAEKAAAVPARGERSADERQREREAQRRQKAEVRRRTRQRARAKRGSRDGTAEETAPRERQPAVQKVRQGVVVSDAPDKTITVRIDVARRHRQYKKIVRTSRTLHAHDEGNDANVGDTVVVRECRPLSRSKRWRLVEVLERAK